MELEGLICCRKELSDEEITVGSLTTDRHVSVDKYMATQLKIDHFFDTWHITKSMTLSLCFLIVSQFSKRNLLIMPLSTEQ